MVDLMVGKALIDRIFGLFLWLFVLRLLSGRIQCQVLAPAPPPSAADAVTDPIEADALNTIFRRWSLTAGSGWNISGELCSGVARNENSFDNFNPIIICNCDFDNGTTCRITRLKVYALNVVGTIPEELQSLKQLIQINFDQNYLSGPIPPFLGNLTNMEVLTLAVNPLSGPLPKELGRLTKLRVIGLGTTNLTGSLPAELGNLVDFQHIFMDGCGLGGEIPSTFSNLTKLETFQASANSFTGKIPDFFGTFTSLKDMTLQGNSFEGPIPSSLGNLRNLSSLRLGDIFSGTSTFDFLKNLTSLTTLVVRNARISDTLQLDFSQYTNLQHLDFSFNNITGSIPQSIFSSSSLIFLFLGNNSLSGGLPAQKSSSLKNIDLSYNKLSGSFPSWVSESDLRLNLVSNNFSLNDSANSLLGAGFQCLQQNIPCNRGSPIYSTFGINCGSRRSITGSDGINYEIDGQDLSTASYYVNPNRKWGVSSVGRFVNAIAPNYTWNVLNQFPNTLDTELFQSARLSPSSLRYYGLGLENGNYTITLRYAETAFPDTNTWQSRGTRIFDIYIQGALMEKDFDIRKEAGGSFRAVDKRYQARVTDNFLEVHFFWAGKGSCCIPTQGTYGPAISAISVRPNFRPTVRAPDSSSGRMNPVIVGVIVGVSVLALLLGLIVFFVRVRRRKAAEAADYENLRAISSSAEIFSYGDLRVATSDFNVENKLGEGGFGPVFKGILADGREVAVKQLLVSSDHGKQQFVAEIATISAVRHKNLVKLLGCCVEGDKRLLVYEYLENGSLDQALFGKRKLKLDWAARMKVCRGTAMGLAYLHGEASSRIVHRDVKASNILLDGDLNPKISDFGLAKLFDDKKTHISTRVAGTIGYLAPEYAFRGQLTERVDVFGFGVLLLEIVSGRPNTDTSLLPEQVYLLELVWRLHENDQELDLVDHALAEVDRDEALSLIRIALMCTQTAQLRPAMTRVVAMLSGDLPIPAATSKPSYIADWNFSDNSSSYPSFDPLTTPSDHSTTVPVLLHSDSVDLVGGR
ncbi:putative LRR receptor-like serine/threonine-protein kinase At1g56140 [Wolffia australiana]